MTGFYIKGSGHHIHTT